MMEAVTTTETSVSFYKTTLRNIPEDSDLRFYCSADVFVVDMVENAKYYEDTVVTELRFCWQRVGSS
jgi:hypothetical protein